MYNSKLKMYVFFRRKLTAFQKFSQKINLKIKKIEQKYLIKKTIQRKSNKKSVFF